jgi:periplasmic copper chaperone A
MNHGLRLAALVAALAASPALAGELSVSGAWARTTPPGIPMGAAYLAIHNDTTKSDHRTEVVEGIARMREVSVLHLAPGERAEFAPGGMHVMLMGLEKPLVEGQTFELELLFEVAGPRKVKVVVRKP